MPEKRHSKGKHAAHGKRKKIQRAALAAERSSQVSQTAGAQVGEATTGPRVATPTTTGAPPSWVADAWTRYGYVVSDLRRIGILGGAIIIVIVVLAVVLR